MTVDEHQNSTLTLRDLRRFGHDTTSCQGMLMACGVHKAYLQLRPTSLGSLGPWGSIDDFGLENMGAGRWIT